MRDCVQTSYMNRSTIIDDFSGGGSGENSRLVASEGVTDDAGDTYSDDDADDEGRRLREQV